MTVNKNMNKLLLIKLFLTMCFVFTFSAFGQSNAKIEQDLVGAIKEVQKYSDYGSNYDEEKLSNANKVFKENLLNDTKNAATLKYSFASLGKLLTIATSDDGKFRIYSWDMETGGTMHEFSRVYQYQGADGKVYSKPESEAAEGDAGSFVYSIFTQKTNNGNVYAVCSTAILSNTENYQTVSLYKIEGNALKDKVKLFKTKEGLTDSIGFEYDFFSVVDRKERPIKLISYDQATKTIRVPIVIQDKKFPLGKVTNKSISYKFDGNYFVKMN
jgi:hypothetical protein